MRSVLSVPREDLVFRILEPEILPDGTLALGYQILAPEQAGAGAEEVLASFVEHVTLPGDDLGPAHGERFTEVLRLLSFAAATSYYKSCIPAVIEVPSGLGTAERTFLEEVIRNGLAEFAYRNEVAEALTPRIEGPTRHERAPEPALSTPRSALVAVGGGKDSITTIEGVRSLDVEVTLFSVNSYQPIRDTAEAAGLPLVEARRRLDPALFALNEAGALNGHVPVTAVNSLIGCLSALRLGIDAVVFSNEASSSAGNTFWAGVEVNHQWSKGIGFERLLRARVGGPELTYFSFLRPLSELAITRQFATLTSYHPVFTSCNRAFHLDEGKRRRWCGDCPKCRFVYLCLSPFVPRATIEAIFTGRDLLADPAQREGFLALFNVGGRLKPFECVGEPDECKVALTLLSRHPEWAGHPFFELPEVAECLVGEAEIAAVFAFTEEHFVPEAFAEVVRGYAD